MIDKIKNQTYKFLRWTEKWTETDMIYLTKGSSWLTAGQIISSLSSLLLSIAFANLLPKETFGVYKYVLSMTSILAIPTLGGLNIAVTQAIARGYEGSLTQALKTKLRWGLLGGLASLVLALYYFINGNNMLALSFIITSVFMPVMESLSIYGSYLNGKKLFKESTQFYVISRIISVFILINTIFLTNNLFIIILSYFLPWTILRTIFFFITIRKFTPNTNKDSQTISYGKHLSLIGIFNSISTYLDNILLFHYLGAIQLAIYAMALAPVEQVRAMYNNINILGIPKLSNKSISEINEKLNKRLFQLFVIGVFIALGYVVITPFFFEIFFPQYSGSILFSQLLAVTLALRLPLSFLTTSVQSKLNITPKSWLYWRILSPVTFIGALLVLAPVYGIIGVIISRVIMLISSFLIYITQWKLLIKKTSN